MEGKQTDAAAEHQRLAHVEGSSYYRPELDVLRFIAFLMVFASHTVPGDGAFYSQLHIPVPVAELIVAVAASGAFGVDLFFLLSSFLITTLLLRERESYGTIDIKLFYLRRLLRIWPLYFAFLLAAAPVLDYLLPTAGMSGQYILAFTLLAGNWACVLWGYPNSVAGPLWSVSMEEQFYLAWPVVMCWTRRLKTVAVVFLLLSFLTRIVLVSAGAEHPQIWCNTLARLDPIACGILLAVLAHQRDIKISATLRMLSIVISFGLLAALGRFGDFAGTKALLTFPIATLACTLLLLSTLGWRLTSRSSPVRALIYLGRISYGLYVFHLLFIVAFGLSSIQDAVARIVSTFVVFLSTVLAAAISYRVLETPFLRLKQKVSRIRSVPEPLALTKLDVRRRTQDIVNTAQ